VNLTLDIARLGGQWYAFPKRKAAAIENVVTVNSNGMYSLPVKGGELIIKVSTVRNNTLYRLHIVNKSGGLQQFSLMNRRELEAYANENALDISVIEEKEDVRLLSS